MNPSELLRRLGRNPFVQLIPERIRTRAYYLFQNRTGTQWWDPASNWLEAELQELREIASVMVIPRLPGVDLQDAFAFERHYELLVTLRHPYEHPNVRPQRLGTKQPRQCSLCNRGGPTATFKKVAHIIPQAFGNRSIVTYDECDECNEQLGNKLDQQLASMLQAERVIGQVPVSQAPSAKASLARKRSSVGGQKQGEPLRVELYKDDSSVSLSFEEGNALALKFPPVKFHPLSAMRSLAKMVWQALPRERRTRYADLRRLVLGELEILPAKLYQAFLPGFLLPFVDLTVWERTSGECDLPELVAQLIFGSTVLLWSVPDFKRGCYIDMLLPRLPLSLKPPHAPMCTQLSIQGDSQITSSGGVITFAYRKASPMYLKEPLPVTLVVEQAMDPPLRVEAELKTPALPEGPPGAQVIYHLEGAKLTGRIEIEEEGESAWGRLLFDGGGRAPQDVRQTLELLHAVAAGAPLKVLKRPGDKELFDCPAGPSAEAPDVRLVQSLALAHALELLNESFGVNLTFPDSLSAEEDRVVALLEKAVRYGRVSEKRADGRFPFPLADRAMAELLLEMLSGGPQDVEVPVRQRYNLQGIVLDPGPALLRLRAARLAGDPAEVRAQLQEWGAEEHRTLMLECERVEYIFHRWLPADAGGTETGDR